MGSASAGGDEQQERWMTVVNLRLRADCAEVMFAESARIYKLMRANPRFDQALSDLRAASERGGSVRVRTEKPNGEIIELVG
jgi:hypothetical protein